MRDLDAERELAADIDAPLECCGLRDDAGALTAAILGGVDTMRFATELQPLLADAGGVIVEIAGQPADYREAGGSLQIGVSTASVTGDTDWFDLRITIRVEGKKIPLPSCSPRSPPATTYLLLADGAYYRARQARAGEARALIEEARRSERRRTARRGSAASRRDCSRTWRHSAGVVRQAEEWQRQVAGLRALQTLDPIAVPRDAARRASARTSSTGSAGWRSCTTTASAASWPTTWAWARRSRRWR